MTQSLAIIILMITDGLCTPLLDIPLTVFICVALAHKSRTETVISVMHNHSSLMSPIIHGLGGYTDSCQFMNAFPQVPRNTKASCYWLNFPN